MNKSSNRWLVLVAMTGSLAMIMLDQTVVTVALPSMGRELGLSAAGEQWVVNAYVLAMAALVALGGKLGDKFGGVSTFRAGVAIFFLASMLCGVAPRGPWGESWIIGARVLQGAGAALMVPVSAAIVIGAFSLAERGRAMAVYTGISQVFLAVGPLLGGFLTETVSWRVVFWLNVPVGILALILVQVARPANVRQSGVRIQAGAVAQLVVGVAAAVLGVQQAGTWGWGAPATLLCLIVGVGLLIWFGVAQARTTSPLVNVRLFGRPAFLGDVVVLGLVQFGLLAVILFSSLYFQNLLEMTPIKAGLAVFPLILALAVAAQLGGRWYDRKGVRYPSLTGLGVALIGLAAWTVALPALTYATQVPGMVLTGFGIGLLMSPTNTDALGRVGPDERSQASGIVQTIRQLGGTLGVAVIGAVVIGVSGGQGVHADRQAAADAITVGFGCAAVTFAIALIAGWRLLSRERIRDTSAGHPIEKASV